MKTTPRSLTLRLTSLRSLGLAVFAFGATVAFGCQALPDIPLDVCGNSVVERTQGEECDGHADESIESGAQFQAYCALWSKYYESIGKKIDVCHPACAGAEEPNACQFVWGETTDANDTLVFQLCPDGFGYGADGVCRRASGHFETEPFITLPAGGFDGTAADLDGDQISDLIVTVADGSTGPHGTYILGGGAVLGPSPIGATPAVGQLSDDSDYGTEIADLVLPLGGALVTLRGAPGPSFDPKAYTPFPFDGQIPVPGWSTAGARILFALDNPDDFAVPMLVADLTPNTSSTFDGLGFLEISLLNYSPSQTVFMLPGVHLNELVPRRDLPTNVPSDNVLSVDLIPDPGAEAVLATSTHVHVVSKDLPGGQMFPPKAGAVITNLVRVENWPVPAVAAVIEAAPVPQVAVLERPAMGAPVFRYFDLPENPDVGTVVSPNDVLALGDIDGDGQLDVVTSHSVLFVDYETQPVGDVPAAVAGARVVARGNLGPGWKRARIADLNGDGRMSVVAASDASSVDVMLPGTSYAMNPVALATGARADQLEIADYDGDGVQDILVATEPSSDGDPCSFEDSEGQLHPSNDDLLLAFGRASGAPEAFSLVGSIPGITRLVTGRLRLDQALDAIADVGLQTSCDPSTLEPVRHAGIMLGSNDRAVYSPFLPFSGPCEPAGFVVAAAIGNVAPFEKDPSHNDLLLLSLRAPPADATGLPAACQGKDSACFRYELTPLPSNGDAEFSILSTKLQCDEAGGPVDRTLSVAVDGADYETLFELAHHAPAVLTADIVPGGEGYLEGLTLTSHVVDGQLTSYLSLSAFDGGVLETHAIPTGLTNADTVAKLRAVNVDGDEDLDVVVVLGYAEVGGRRATRSWLFINDPTGSPRLSDPVELKFSGGVGLAEVDVIDPVRDVVTLQPPFCSSPDGDSSVDCDPKRTLFLVDQFGAQVCADIDPQTGVPGLARSCSFVGLGQDATANDPIFGAVVGDFDTDGLEDVAILRELSVTIHRQCPLSEVYAGRCSGFASGSVGVAGSDARSK